MSCYECHYDRVTGHEAGCSSSREQVFRERFSRENDAKKRLAEEVLEAGRRASYLLNDTEIANILEKIAREARSGRLR